MFATTVSDGTGFRPAIRLETEDGTYRIFASMKETFAGEDEANASAQDLVNAMRDAALKMMGHYRYLQVELGRSGEGDEVYDLIDPSKVRDVFFGKKATEETCPGHVASESDPKICARCGTHIDSLRTCDNYPWCEDQGCTYPPDKCPSLKDKKE